MEPTFSVVIPTYDRAHLLPRAIESVLNQTFEDFELIVVDDGSTDDTREVVASFTDERIVYVRREETGGAAAARNTGIRHAKGKYVSFLDDDDEYLPQYLTVMHGVMQNASGRPGFAWSGIRIVDDQRVGTPMLCELMWSAPEFGDRAAEKDYVLRHAPGTGCMTVRAECFERVGLFDAQLKSGEDLDMVIRLAQHFSFRAIPQALVTVHRHRHQQLSWDTGLKAAAYERILQKHRDYLSQHPQALAFHYAKAGQASYLAGKRNLGRKQMYESLQVAPLQLSTWRMLFFLELFGEPLPRQWKDMSVFLRRISHRRSPSESKKSGGGRHRVGIE
jgi:glycosyltransferase involved in cell wall biosynthesis